MNEEQKEKFKEAQEALINSIKESKPVAFIMRSLIRILSYMNKKLGGD